MDADDYELLKDSLSKLGLKDASFTFEPETSAALGMGYRYGFGMVTFRDYLVKD